MNDKNNYVLIRDGVVFDGCFDAQEEAEGRKKSFERYIGRWDIVPMTDRQFKKYMRGGVVKAISDLRTVRAVGNLTRGFSRQTHNAGTIKP